MRYPPKQANDIDVLTDSCEVREIELSGLTVQVSLPIALAWEVMHSFPSVGLSVRLFPLYMYLWNRLTVDPELLHAGRL